LLIVRPEPGASATLARARALHLPAEAVPLFAVEPLPWTAPEPADFDALLLTSANAPRHAGEQLRRLAGLPVHAVGAATAEAARAAGLTVASVGTAGVEVLLATLPQAMRLLHLCGEERTGTTSRPLITHVPVYRSEAIDAPDALERAAEAVVLVHSPRAGRRLAELLRHKSAVRIAAISPAAAAACGSGWAVVEAAPEPTDAALLSLAARLCQQPQP
jgi:uroporphyrinogen-III synthase